MGIFVEKMSILFGVYFLIRLKNGCLLFLIPHLFIFNYFFYHIEEELCVFCSILHLVIDDRCINSEN